ncbi:MAG: hypothetical protein BGO01_16360 [Armatimonadetes bacterium 55-13]|nr:MAG: hypothetical protein BGO01_16360 [Armatimonadetes bacterium 55-13]
MKKLTLFAAMAISAISLGKGYIQDWTPKLPPWASIVYSCDKPVPYRLVAADDFTLDFELPVTNINWWGVVTTKEQLSRPYYIAIYKENGNCQPAWTSIIWSDCVKPYQAELAGEDCKGNRVWKFYSNVPIFNPLTLGPGHYWLQISESDKDSYKPGAVDFWWSSHQQFVKCPALQMDSLGNIFQPLIDPCNQKIDDLAFEIY